MGGHQCRRATRGSSQTGTAQRASRMWRSGSNSDLRYHPRNHCTLRSSYPQMAHSGGGGPATWDGEAAHPAPRRMIFVTVQGEYEIRASDGVTRKFPVGSVLLL